MSNPVSLTVVKAGIQRQRVKGAALKDSLYDLVNGYVTSAKTVVVRPGSRRRNVPLHADTRGLTSFDGELHVFAAETLSVPTGYVLHVISHPDSPALSAPLQLAKIHFAEPIMNALYVVAEFENGDTYHYWLQSGPLWQANTIYKVGDIVEPSTPNGLAYQATRISAPYPSWAPSVRRQVDDIIEPTEFNNFYYTVVNVEGGNPASGTTEPDWPTEDGAQIVEDTEAVGVTGGTTTEQPDVDRTPAPATQDRYGTGTNA